MSLCPPRVAPFVCVSVCPSHSATRCHQELAVQSIPGAEHPKGPTAPYGRELWDVENPVTWSTVGPGGPGGTW